MGCAAARPHMWQLIEWQKTFCCIETPAAQSSTSSCRDSTALRRLGMPTCAELRRLCLPCFPSFPPTSDAEQPSHAVCHLPHTSRKAVQTVPKPGVDCPDVPDLAQPFCKAAPFETKQPLLGAACLCQRQIQDRHLLTPTSTYHQHSNTMVVHHQQCVVYSGHLPAWPTRRR